MRDVRNWSSLVRQSVPQLSCLTFEVLSGWGQYYVLVVWVDPLSLSELWIWDGRVESSDLRTLYQCRDQRECCFLILADIIHRREKVLLWLFCEWKLREREQRPKWRLQSKTRITGGWRQLRHQKQAWLVFRETDNSFINKIRQLRARL